VLLLEARDRTGGRVHTLHGQGWRIPLELGAEFVHGDADATMRVAASAGLSAIDLQDRHVWVTGARWTPRSAFWDEFQELCRQIRPGRRDRSFADFLAARKRQGRREELARLIVEGYHAAPADDMSARSLAEAAAGDTGSDRQRRFPRGYDGVTDALRAALDPDRVEVRLSTAVRRVTHRRGEARVEAVSALGSPLPPIVARAALVTLPLGVLRAPEGAPGSVVFDPPLRSKQAALAGLGVARVHKVVLRFREAFWEEASFVQARTGDHEPAAFDFLHAPAAALPTWWTSAPAGAPVLTGWVGGPAAARLDGRTPRAMLLQALDALARVLCCPRRTVETRLDAWAWHDWQADPFARGAYAYPRVGGASAADALARPVGALHFAGEATEPDEMGTVSGAIASGRRAARAIIGA
jgi:monoamine oxidase